MYDKVPLAVSQYEGCSDLCVENFVFSDLRSRHLVKCDIERGKRHAMFQTCASRPQNWEVLAIGCCHTC